jgi:hypothetical protein
VNPDTFFAEALAASSRALERVGKSADRHIRIADFSVRLVFAGEAMQDSILPAFAHLEEKKIREESDLTVTIWDGASTKTPVPFSADFWNDCTAWGEVRSLRGSHVHASRLMDVGVYSAVDLRNRQALYWTHDAGLIPNYARAAPLRSILHAWLRSRGRIFLHGAAIAREGQTVLLVGKGGSGKSTTALICAYAGWQYLGDDYCAASSSKSPQVHSLYNSAKLTSDQLLRFPRWAEADYGLKDPLSGKTILFLANDPDASLLSGGLLRAILLPAVTGAGQTTWSEESPLTLWKSLAPSTTLQLPGANQEDLTLMADLVRSVPGYRINLGTDYSAIPGAIAEAAGLE